jgi:hypothetical protein
VVDKYPVPSASDFVYIGPPPHFDVSTRRAYFAPDEASRYDISNAAVDFRMKAAVGDLPAWLPRLAERGIYYLQTDGEILNSLKDVIRHIEYGLFVDGKVPKSVNWKDVESGLKYLWINDAEVFFNENSFASVEFLKAKVDKSGKLLGFVSKNEGLDHLGISGFDRQVIDAARTISSLQISNANDRSIDFDEKPGLTELWVHNLKSLETIEFARRLPDLKGIKIYYCKKVADFSPLLSLDNLEAVEIIQQGDPKDTETLKKLAERGVKIEGVEL